MKSLQTNLKWTFFGTDIFAVRVLETLKNEGLLPTLIITTPDTPQGRHLTLTPPPIKLWAKENGIQYSQPAKLTDPDFLKALEANEATQIQFLVASYGKIIPEKVFTLPKFGTLNIHPSLLPKYRGASPIQSAILNGDKETGITIMKLDNEVDHGAIVAQEVFNLVGDENFEGLRDSLAELGAQLFTKILPDWLEGKIIATEQNHSQATLIKKIKKTDGEIKLTDNPIINYRKYRALTPKPGIYFFDQNHKRFIIKSARFENNQFIILRVTPEGEKEINW
ncbi:MAG: methionyl-tRNA formyltransferase [Patescibacteria group bacterium]